MEEIWVVDKGFFLNPAVRSKKMPSKKMPLKRCYHSIMLSKSSCESRNVYDFFGFGNELTISTSCLLLNDKSLNIIWMKIMMTMFFGFIQHKVDCAFTIEHFS